MRSHSAHHYHRNSRDFLLTCGIHDCDIRSVTDIIAIWAIAWVALVQINSRAYIQIERLTNRAETFYARVTISLICS